MHRGSAPHLTTTDATWQVTVVGSFAAEAVARPNTVVDVAMTIPRCPLCLGSPRLLAEAAKECVGCDCPVSRGLVYGLDGLIPFLAQWAQDLLLWEGPAQPQVSCQEGSLPVGGAAAVACVWDVCGIGGPPAAARPPPPVPPSHPSNGSIPSWVCHPVSPGMSRFATLQVVMKCLTALSSLMPALERDAFTLRKLSPGNNNLRTAGKAQEASPCFRPRGTCLCDGFATPHWCGW